MSQVLRPDWHQHDLSRALFALEHVWAAQALRPRTGVLRVCLVPELGMAQDAAPGSVVLARTPEESQWHGAVRADWPALPFADGSVGQLLVQHALDDMARAGALLTECARVLADDGEMLLFGLSPAGWARLCMRRLARRPHRVRLPGRLRAALEAQDLIVSAPLGLGGERVEAVAAPGRWLRMAYVLRARKQVARVIPFGRMLSERGRALGAFAPSQRNASGVA